MYLVTIQYPNSKGATFDFDHFHRDHLPAVGRAFAPFGLGWGTVMRGEQSLDGSDPAFFAIMVLSFPTEQSARNALAGQEGKALLAEVAGFTSAQPVIQFNTPIK